MLSFFSFSCWQVLRAGRLAFSVHFWPRASRYLMLGGRNVLSFCSSILGLSPDCIALTPWMMISFWRISSLLFLSIQGEIADSVNGGSPIQARSGSERAFFRAASASDRSHLAAPSASDRSSYDTEQPTRSPKTVPHRNQVDPVPIPRDRPAEYPLDLHHEKTGHQIPEPYHE